MTLSVNELHNIVKNYTTNDPLYIYCYGDPYWICKLYNNNYNIKSYYIKLKCNNQNCNYLPICRHCKVESYDPLNEANISTINSYVTFVPYSVYADQYSYKYL